MICRDELGGDVDVNFENSASMRLLGVNFLILNNEIQTSKLIFAVRSLVSDMVMYELVPVDNMQVSHVNDRVIAKFRGQRASSSFYERIVGLGLVDVGCLLWMASYTGQQHVGPKTYELVIDIKVPVSFRTRG